MTIALTDDHVALSEVARAFLAARGGLGPARETLDAPGEALPGYWKDLCELGWTGIHLPEAHGGQGFGLAELAVVVEELGRVVAPGPFLPTVVASATIAACGDDDQRQSLLPGLADGSCIAALALAGTVERDGQGRLRGDAGSVAAAGLANLLLVAVGDDVAVVDRAAEGLHLGDPGDLDPTRPLGMLRCDGVEEYGILPGARRTATRVLRVLAAAEAAGAARMCTEAATAYALERVQFGRIIGAFQAVKHHCANMLVAAEAAAAAAWDALGAPEAESDHAAAIAATIAIPAVSACARLNIQIHGGIGFTWEHDAHLFLRRAGALEALVGSGAARVDVARGAAGGAQRSVALTLPPEAEEFRAEIRAFRAGLDALGPDERREALLESGYLVPHYPRPWGRGAGAVEQVVIEQELGDFEAPALGIGSWILPAVAMFGTPEQHERWMWPSLREELYWCQLFSEPDAGSDAAAIRTKAVRVEGGWKVSGQKVWTSGAHESTHGFATVRTNPDVPRHKGITMMAIDMRAPGVTVTPLREMTGETMFAEVFLDEVFVPDDDVVGPVDGGWTVARSTLGFERVSIGGGSSEGLTITAHDLLGLWERRAGGDTALLGEIGGLVAEEQTVKSLALRNVARAISGGQPGPEGNVTKLLASEHAQRVADLGLRIAAAAIATGEEPEVARSFLFCRCLTIAGGTSEINRNVIGEHLLGLPREKIPA